MHIEIKREYKQTVIATGNNGLPLGSKPKSEILDIAILARQSKDSSLLKMFKNLPPLETLLQEKVNNEISSLNIAKPGTPIKTVEIPKDFTGVDPKELLD